MNRLCITLIFMFAFKSLNLDQEIFKRKIWNTISQRLWQFHLMRLLRL
jgi:hypothetical protein